MCARWSPTVPVSRGPTLGDVLANGIDEIMAIRRQRKLDREHDEQLAYEKSQRPLKEAATLAELLRYGVVPHEAGGDSGLGGALQESLGGGGPNLGIGDREALPASSVFNRQPSIVAQRPQGGPNLPIGSEPFTPGPHTHGGVVPIGHFDVRTGTFSTGQAPQAPQQQARTGRRRLNDQYDYDPSMIQQARTQPLAAQHLDLGNEIVVIDPQTGQPIQRYPKAADVEKPRNIDPLSPEGIAANRQLIAYREQMAASLAAQKAAQTAQAPKKIPASVMQGLSKNDAAVQRIQDAIDALKAYPDAVGLKRVVGEDINQRVDPKGIDARAKLARIAAIEIHTQAGSNQTARELVNLRPYIPNVRDGHEAAIEKLENLKRAVANETEGLRRNYGLDEVAVPSGGTGNIDLRGPQAPAHTPAVSDADLWEQLVASGVPKAEATRRVQARHK